MLTTLTLALFLFPQSDLDAAMASAEAHAAKAEWSAAVSVLRDAGAEDVDDAKVLGALGRFILRETEAGIASGAISGFEINDAFSDAAWVLEKACGASDALAADFVNLSEAQLNAGNAELALIPVGDGLAKFSNSAALYMQKARVLGSMSRDALEGGNVKKAAKLEADSGAALTKAAAVEPKNATPWIRMGEQAILAGNREKAISSWLEGVKRNATGVDLGRAVQWLQSDAGGVIDAVIAELGSDATREWYRGTAYFAADPMPWESVRDAFKKVLELNPQFLNAYYYLSEGAMREATRLQQNGDDRRSAKGFYIAAKYLGLYIDSFAATYLASAKAAGDGGAGMVTKAKWLAGHAVTNGDFKAAISLMDFATQAAPEDVEAWNNLGFFHREAGNAIEAEAGYAKAAELSPNDPQVLNDWAVIYHYYLKTEDAKALGLYEQSIDLANKLLSKGGLESEEEARVRVALRDATNNQAKLKKGNRRNG